MDRHQDKTIGLGHVDSVQIERLATRRVRQPSRRGGAGLFLIEGEQPAATAVTD